MSQDVGKITIQNIERINSRDRLQFYRDRKKFYEDKRKQEEQEG